nr:MAG TPA: hypothetical protein [Caudoviricetes sp.]
MPQIAYEKSQSNPRHACALNIVISTQIALLLQTLLILALLRSIYSDPLAQNNARKRKNQIYFFDVCHKNKK